MKKIIVLLLMLLLFCSGCRPEEEQLVTIGTEDGGGSGYGVSAKSVLNLSDFYFITQNSTRINNRITLGTPVYVLGESETYTLSDGSQVVLTYDTKGVLHDALYTDFESGKSYGLFDKLVQLGVLRGEADSGDTPSENGDTENHNGGQQTDGGKLPVLSDKTYEKQAFDGGLSLYLDRTAVLTTFGAPNSFAGRFYKKDSYIIDCYRLNDGSTLLLDYGFDRKSLRCAAIKGADGVTKTYLGAWTAQSKPADFVRPRIELNQVTSLSKGTNTQKVYETLGEPAWFEGAASNYRDAYMLSDGSTVYLSYDDGHGKLTDAHQLTVEGKLLKVSLR